MNDEPLIENESDLAKRIETPGSNVESKAEESESDSLQGAELLETAPTGDYRASLQTFFNWVKNKFAK